MDLATLLSEGTMCAAARIAADKNIDLDPHLDRMIAAMRTEVLAGYESVMKEGELALGAHMPSSFLQHQLNVSCNLFAVRALRQCGLLPQNVMEHKKCIRIQQRDSGLYSADVYKTVPNLGEVLLYCIATDMDKEQFLAKVVMWNMKHNLKIVAKGAGL
jgi:hypothetical protein